MEKGKAFISPALAHSLGLNMRGDGSIKPRPRLIDPNKDCGEPNPDAPHERCKAFAGLEHEHHTWWYCTSSIGGDLGDEIECELIRGHDGNHRASWS